MGITKASHSIGRLVCLSVIFGSVAAYSSSAQMSGRNTQLALQGAASSVANDRLKDKNSKESAYPIVPGQMAWIKGIGDSKAPAPLGTVMIDKETGVTSVTVYSGKPGIPSVHGFLRVGDSSLVPGNGGRK